MWEKHNCSQKPTVLSETFYLTHFWSWFLFKNKLYSYLWVLKWKYIHWHFRFFYKYSKNLDFQLTAFSSVILLLSSENRFKHSSLLVFFLKSDEFMLKKERKPFDFLLQKLICLYFSYTYNPNYFQKYVEKYRILMIN